MRYRLMQPLVGARMEFHEKSSVVTIPAGDIVTTAGHHPERGLIQAEWSRERVLVFAQDLRLLGVALSL